MFNYQRMRNPARFCLALLQIAQDWERLCQERGRCSQPPTLLEPPRVEHQEPQLPKIKKKTGFGSWFCHVKWIQMAILIVLARISRCSSRPLARALPLRLYCGRPGLHWGCFGPWASWLWELCDNQLKKWTALYEWKRWKIQIIFAILSQGCFHMASSKPWHPRYSKS